METLAKAIHQLDQLRAANEEWWRTWNDPEFGSEDNCLFEKCEAIARRKKGMRITELKAEIRKRLSPLRVSWFGLDTLTVEIAVKHPNQMRAIRKRANKDEILRHLNFVRMKLGKRRPKHYR